MDNLLFDALSRRFSDTKLVFEECGGAGQSYRALGEAVDLLASALSALGVSPGDRVAVQVEKSRSFVALYLACVRTGAIFLPLNTAYTVPELSYFLNDAEPVMLICNADALDKLSPLAKSLGVKHVH